MKDRIPATVSLAAVRRRARPAVSSSGFTILELVMVLAIAMILLKISLPVINTSLHNMHLNSAASSLAGAIQSARYQAISTGCPININVSATPVNGMLTYQVATEPISGTPPACGASFVNGGLIPYSSSDISVSSATPSATLQLNPSGTVGTVGVSTPTNFTIALAQLNGAETKLVTVSGVGNVKITCPDCKQ
jgi:type II secretory pathway pseudopilin PulG